MERRSWEHVNVSLGKTLLTGDLHELEKMG